MPNKIGIMFRVGKENKDIQDMTDKERIKALNRWNRLDLYELIDKLLEYIRTFT